MVKIYCQGPVRENISLINFSCNKSDNTSSKNEDDSILPINMIIHSTIACIGIIANSTVVVVFLNHKKLRQKIPNIFIINQVLLQVDLITFKESILIFGGSISMLVCGAWLNYVDFCSLLETWLKEKFKETELASNIHNKNQFVRMSTKQFQNEARSLVTLKAHSH